MNENKPATEPEKTHTSWFERLSDMLLREPKNREQLLEILRDAAGRDIISPEMLAMVERVLQVSDRQVRDVMVPKSQIIVVEYDSPLEKILPEVIESGHSRFPVVKGAEVSGILLAKDLLDYSEKDERDFHIEDLLRPAFFVPQSKRLDVLLREFRVNRNHIAVVVDEYGHVAGIITIEDVLEEIVGEIEDEYDTNESDDIRQRSENIHIVKAATPIEDFNAYFGEKFSDEEFDTIGGIVTKGFGHVPKRGEIIQLGKFHFRVLNSDSRRVQLLEVWIEGKK